MANTKKSWKGAPTTNICLINGQTGVNPWGGDGAPTPLGIDDTVTFRGRRVAKYRTGTSGNCYLNGVGDLSSAINSTDWTSTIYFKRVDGAPVASVGRYLYVSNNTSVNLAVSTIAVEDGWYKSVYTRSGLIAGYPTLTGMYSLGASVEYYFAEWQVEPLPYSTPYVDGTRIDTQSIIDLTKNHTITVNSITSDNDNIASFGAGNYLTLPSSVGYTTEFSQFAWFKSFGAPTGGYHIIFGDSNAELSIPTGGSLRVGVTTPTRFVGNLSSGLTDGNWHYIGMTYKTSDGFISGYKDGEYVGQVAATAGTLTTSFTRTIGRFGASGTYYTNGRIDHASIYNRALSAVEVKQNFEAMRGRYGI